MTSISAMRFSKYAGAIIADEQSSTGYGRKYETANKLAVFHRQNNKHDKKALIIGGSGIANVLLEIVEKAQAAGITTPEELGNIMCTIRRELIDAYLLTNFQYTEDEILRGYKIIKDKEGKPVDRIEIGPAVKERYEKFMEQQQRQGMLQNRIISLAYDPEQGIRICEADMHSTYPTPIPQQYTSIGSGADTADQMLYNFVSRQPREQRMSIEPMEGISALLLATHTASSRNVGVGGVPQLYVVSGEHKKAPQIITPSESQTLLALEITRGKASEYLPDAFARDALHELVFNNGDFETIEKEMWKAAGDHAGDFNRMLRGYHTPLKAAQPGQNVHE